MKSMLKNIKKKFTNKKDEHGNLIKVPAGAGDEKSSSSSGSSKPKSSKKRTMSTMVRSGNGLNKTELLQPQSTFNETPAAGRPQLFIRKLKLCSISFEWYDETNSKDNRAKEVKRQILLELVDYIGKNKGIYTEQVLEELLTMVSENLFRALPPSQAQDDDEGEGEDPLFEPSWPHLQIVYEFFLRFIVSSDVDVKTLKRYINSAFVLRLLDLFDSEDPRERDYLKTILHRIYAKFMSLRSFIRRAISHAFSVFIYETGRHNGVAELLEILGSIINGFALPLKQEHKTFLTKVLTPMHKVKSLAAFHQQLSYCVTQFVDKDPTLAVPVISGLVLFWPTTSSSKELLFLSELEELLELTQPEEFQVLTPKLFKCLKRCIGSPHFQVAERALFLWHNDYIASLIADHRDKVLPIIFDVLHVNSKSHWNPTVNNLTMNVLKIFMELDSKLVDKCTKKYEADLAPKQAGIKAREARWITLEKKAGL